MKKLFLLLSTVFVFAMSCSDPCESVNCNQGTCDDGTCICDTGYEGDDCSTEMRTKFIGTWNGHSVCGSQDTDSTFVIIRKDSTNISKVSVMADNVTLIGTISGNNITLEETDFIGIIFSGAGSINGTNQLEITFDIDDEGDKNNCIFTGTK